MWINKKKYYDHLRKVDDAVGSVDQSMQFNGRRVDALQKEVNALETRIEQLECSKHEYKFTCVRDRNKLYRMYRIMSMFRLSDNRFVFTCTKCKKEIELKESELSMAQSASLIALGLLKSKVVVKK